ncbi:MAG: hypothetical protein L6R36_007881 [Xanthoria steineri]|nr:MAG: hypothetical protein L6R36_007881 [Xanthoria steineri]
MPSFNWPRPPNLGGLSAAEAVSATQIYVNQVRIHMGGLQRNSTEYGVLIGFMLSALSDATKIFDLVCQDPATRPAIRDGINDFGLDMQSLVTYMDHISNRPESQRPVGEGSSYRSEHSDFPEAADSADFSIDKSLVVAGSDREERTIESNEDREAQKAQSDFCGMDPAKSVLERMSEEELRRQLSQDFHDQGIRCIPLSSCAISRDRQHVLFLTSTHDNAAILRDPSIRKPTLFGENAAGVATLSTQEGQDIITTSSLQNLVKTQRAEEKAEKSTRLVWLEIPDRDFAKAKLVAQHHNQTRSVIEWELLHQHIDVRIQKVKKSSACNHIRLWTVSPEEADVLVNQWKPEWFGKGAYVCLKREEEQQGSRHDALTSLEATRDHTDAGIPVDAPPPLPPSIENQKDSTEVFVKIPDRQFAEDQLVGLSSTRLQTVARIDLQRQGIRVRVASCQIIASGSFARLRTREPEEAEFLRLPGVWNPMAFGKGAYVVTD